VELVGDCRRYGGGIVCRMDPVVAGERIAELLELPDGCNALLSMVLMGDTRVGPPKGCIPGNP